MRLLPARTRGDGNCAFHAACGQSNGQEYVYDNIQALRKQVADKVRAISIASHNLFPSVNEAIKELIRGKNQQIKLDPQQFPIITYRQQTYKANDEGFEDLENFNPELNGAIVKEYANFIETPGMWLLPCELSIIAYACDISIQYFSTHSETQQLTLREEYNPGMPTLRAVYFNDRDHYQAMVEESVFGKYPVDYSRVHVQPTPNLEGQGWHKTSALKNTFHGNIYQAKLLMLFLHHGFTEDYEFCIATEMDAAEKFDDLVFRYRDPQTGQYIYFYLQAKHKQDDNEVISFSDFFTKNLKGEFSLIKYFISYLRIKNNPLFKDGQLGDFCICTNIGLSTDTHNLFEPVAKSNTVLGSNQYRFKKNNLPGKIAIYETLKLGGSEMITLARTLAQCIQDKTGVSKKTPIFKDHYDWLIENEIITDGKKTTDRKLTEKFIRGYPLSDGAIWFRQLYYNTNQSWSQLTDADVDEFFDHLLLAVRQPNEVRLGEMIARKVGEELNLIDSSFIYADFQKAVLDWMKATAGNFLTQDAVRDFFKDMQQRLSKLAFIGSTINYHQKLEEAGLTFQPLPSIHAFLTQFTHSVMVYQTSQDLFLGSIRVYQNLLNIEHHKKSDSHIFISLRTALRLSSLLKEAFKQGCLLVIVCNTPVEGKAKALIQDLLNYLHNQSLLIFITPTNPVLTEMVQASTPPLRIEEESGFNSLTQASQNILRQRTILFQGREIPLGQLTHQLDQIVDANVLAQLIRKQTTSVGESLEHAEERLYVERICTQKTALNTAVFSNTTDILAVWGGQIKKAQLSALIAENNSVRLFNEAEPEPTRPSRYIILDDDQALVQFKALQEKYPKHNIHLLKYEESNWIWQSSYGSFSTPYRHRKEVAIPSTPFISHTVISAEPGMGKSTTLTHVVSNLQISNPTVRIIKIILRSKEEELKTVQFTHFDEVAAFCIPNADPLDIKLFAHCLTHEGKMTICLDGFDELQKDQQNKIIALLTFLKTTKAQIIITTRKHLQETLETTLNTFATDLVPFTEDDALTYLQDFWTDSLNLNETEQLNAKTYAEALLSVFRRSVGESRHFIGIPLQARLLAEAFLEEVTTFIRSNKPETNLPEKLTLPALYKKFIEAKYQIYCQIKLGLGKTVQALIVQNGLTPTLSQSYQQAALAYLSFEYPDLIQDYDIDLLQSAGIIQLIQGKIDFIHRTFAEYFAALFFVVQLEKLATHTDHQKASHFLKQYIFKAQYQIVRTFIDQLVQSKNQTALSTAWKAIVDSHYSSDTQNTRISKIHIVDSFSPPITPIQQFTRSSLTITEAKELLGNRYALPTDNPDRLTDDTINFCYAFLTTTNKKELDEALPILFDIKFANQKPVRNAVGKRLPKIFRHYIQTCIAQKQEFNNDLIQQFYSYAYYESKSGKSLMYTVDKYTFDTIAKLNKIVKNRADPSSTAFIKDLTPEKIIYLSLIPDLDVSEALFTALRNTYITKKHIRNGFSLFFRDLYSELFIKGTQKWVNDGWLFLLENKEYSLLSELISQSPSFTPSEVNTILQRVSNHFKKNTTFEAQPLLGSIWAGIIQPLLKRLATDQTPEDFDIVTLLEICVYSLRSFEGTYWPIKITGLNLQSLLQLIETMLNHEKLNTRRLSIGINLLHQLAIKGLHFVNTDTSILVFDINSGFEYELNLPHQIELFNLLQFKNNDANVLQEKEFLEKCAYTLTFTEPSSKPLLKRNLSAQNIRKTN